MASTFSIRLPWNVSVSSASAILLVIYLAWSAKSYWRLRHFPGPWPARFTRLWYAKLIWGGSMAKDTAILFENPQQGPIVRIGPNTLVTNDPDMVRRMTATKSPYTRAESYKVFKFNANLDNVISTVDEERHTYLRNKMAHGYAGKGNLNLERQIDNQLEKMIELIDRDYKSLGSHLRPLDFARLSQYFALDAITDVAFSRPLGYLVSGSDHYDYIDNLRQSMALNLILSTLPLAWSFFDLGWIRTLIAPSPTDAKGFGRLMGIAKEVIAERFGADKIVKHDMIDSFIVNGLTQAECESETMLQVIAGSDTTATALRTTMFHIISQPLVYHALRAEIDTASDRNHLTSPIASDLEARKLPYLQACIKEGLRICPPGTGLFDKITPAEGDSYRGQMIPGNTRIGMANWAMQRSQEIYGADANYFRPERWLESEGEQKLRMERTHELVFSAGRYTCVGRNIALIELNKAILEVGCV
ncbi:MAG: hypothetical protein Q9212_003604 [Teloschistes hypoglaucus]